VVIYSSGSLNHEAHFALAIVSALVVWSYSLQSDKKSLLDSRIMVRLGLWSYSLYLVHRLIQNAAAGLHLRSTNVAFYDGLIFFLLLAVAIFSAGFLYHFVEEPARKYLNRRPYFRKPRQPSA
jgi:peptidoglycan/LPS O-acetylase OafA/YrhL